MQRRSFLFVLAGLPAAGTLAQGVGDTPAQPFPPDPAQTHVGTGTVNSVDVREGKVNLAHDPIPSLAWPAMTMDFVVSDREQLAALKPGQRVRFEMRPIGNQYVISAIGPARTPAR